MPKQRINIEEVVKPKENLFSLVKKLQNLTNTTIYVRTSRVRLIEKREIEEIAISSDILVDHLITLCNEGYQIADKEFLNEMKKVVLNTKIP